MPFRWCQGSWTSCRWSHEDHHRRKWEQGRLDWQRTTSTLIRHRELTFTEKLGRALKTGENWPMEGVKESQQGELVSWGFILCRWKADGFILDTQEIVVDEIQDLQLGSGERGKGSERSSLEVAADVRWGEKKGTLQPSISLSFCYSGLCGTKTAWCSRRLNEAVIFAISRKVNF